MSPFVSLGTIAEINPPGPTRSELAPDALLDFVPMAAVSESGQMVVPEQREFRELGGGFTAFQADDVLVAKITPCFENNKITRASVQSIYAFGSTEFHVVRCQSGVLDPGYLTYFLRQDRIRRDGERWMTGSAGQRRVPRQFLEELPVPVPPIAEQKRLATILDQADDARRKRKVSLQHLDALKASIFFETFIRQDDASWPMQCIGDLAKDMRTGPFGSKLLHSEFVDDGIAVLGIDNAVKNEFSWDERRFITEEKYRALRRFTVHPGDVLITIMGTCGRCAIVPRDIPIAINTKHLCCITLNAEKALPAFVHAALLMHPGILRQLGVSAKGAVMPGLNMGIIRALEFRVPPVRLQQAFMARIVELEAVRYRFRAHGERLESLFHSLQHQAFSGKTSPDALGRKAASHAR